MRRATSKNRDATGPRRRTAYSYADKAKFLDAYHEELRRNPYVTLAPIAKLHGVHLSTAISMVKDEPSIRQALKVLSPQATKSISRKRKRHMAPVETSLLNWFKRERIAGFKVTDGRLRGTALLIWRDLRKNILPEDQPIKFKFSNGWLSRFKNRHGLKKYTTHGESGSVDMAACKPRIDEIQRILADFDPEDIYSCDETGLFLKTTSNTSIDLGPVLGRKIIRDARVSILFCSNATGSDKRRPFILSQHKPMGLSAETLRRIDADYCCTGYMTEMQFTSWLQAFDQDMQRNMRNIALLIGGAPGHCKADISGLTNITIIRLPPGSTSTTQPIDAGVVRSFKANYAVEMIEISVRIREKIRERRQQMPNGPFWTCMANAWDLVTPGCIRNSFAQVPIMPLKHERQLRDLGVETMADQVKQLQEELKQKYGDDCDLVAGQNDFTILHYLDMIDSEGPSLSISESIREVLESEEYQDLFIAREDRGTIDEELLDDAEEDEDEDEDEEEHQMEEARDSSQDCDYEPPSSDNFNFDQEDSIVPRSREVERLPDDGFASPPSSPFREEILDDEPFRYNMERFAEARASIMSSNNKELAARYAAIALSIDTFLDHVNLESGEGEYEGVDGDNRNAFR